MTRTGGAPVDSIGRWSTPMAAQPHRQRLFRASLTPVRIPRPRRMPPIAVPLTRQFRMPPAWRRMRPWLCRVPMVRR